MSEDEIDADGTTNITYEDADQTQNPEGGLDPLNVRTAHEKRNKRAGDDYGNAHCEEARRP